MPMSLYNTPQGILLRPFSLADSEALLALRLTNRESHAPYEPLHGDSFFTLEEQEEYIRQKLRQAEEDRGYSFGIFLLEDERLIGYVSISNLVRGMGQFADIGYMMDQHEQGKGHMTAALKLAIQFAFRALSLHRLQAGTLLHNERSQRVLQKCGFQPEGIARKLVQIQGTWQDHRMFGLLAEDHVWQTRTGTPSAQSHI
ncbi:acetyltransferase [Paenibacillus sp. IHB B 3084]|uniref:GNAT family N-acetyltransferase n=1 Tax=Paenibacillus TaxID=44249 RepID=UPI000722138F|nr:MULTISPECIES: GNAT family protein [Paenibacillus]ALP36675.1 acetyltransferase [Paenibacillus sp. IHB B 3084]MBE0339024.1 N-acetyltransferase [Paenibacillus sp. 23TSA30-6]